MVASSFRSTCNDARGLRAGATIAVLGGRCAEGRASMPAPSVEDLSNDDLLVQLNELCEEVGWRVNEYLREEDRDKLAEGVAFVTAAEYALQCNATERIMGGISWASRKLVERAAETRLARTPERDGFEGFLDEHPELEADDAQ
jgi:hypothetical protein